MMTDKEIRQFIKANGVKVRDSEKFMQDVRRQLDLLPAQSALKDNDVRMIRAILKAEVKYNRVNAIFTAALSLFCMAALAVILFYLLPSITDVNPSIVKYNYLIFGALSLILSAVSLRSIFQTI